TAPGPYHILGDSAMRIANRPSSIASIASRNFSFSRRLYVFISSSSSAVERRPFPRLRYSYSSGVQGAVPSFHFLGSRTLSRDVCQKGPASQICICGCCLWSQCCVYRHLVMSNLECFLRHISLSSSHSHTTGQIVRRRFGSISRCHPFQITGRLPLAFLAFLLLFHMPKSVSNSR